MTDFGIICKLLLILTWKKIDSNDDKYNDENNDNNKKYDINHILIDNKRQA